MKWNHAHQLAVGQRNPGSPGIKDKKVYRQGRAPKEQNAVASPSPGQGQGQEKGQKNLEGSRQANQRLRLGQEPGNETDEVFEIREMRRPGEKIGENHDAETDFLEHNGIITFNGWWIKYLKGWKLAPFDKKIQMTIGIAVEVLFWVMVISAFSFFFPEIKKAKNDSYFVFLGYLGLLLYGLFFSDQRNSSQVRVIVFILRFILSLFVLIFIAHIIFNNNH